MPMLYKGLFKAWTIFKRKRLEVKALFFVARLDRQDGARVSLTGMLFSKKSSEDKLSSVLRQIVQVTGPTLQNAEAKASLIGLKSHHAWFGFERLTLEEKQMLMDYFNGNIFPDALDPIPEMGLNIDFTGVMGPFIA